MDQITPKEVKILENAEDIQDRREQVLGRYANFKSEARSKRDKLEDSRRFQVTQTHTHRQTRIDSLLYIFQLFFVKRAALHDSLAGRKRPIECRMSCACAV